MHKNLTADSYIVVAFRLNGVLKSSMSCNKYGSSLTLYIFIQDKRSGEGHVQHTYTRFTLFLATLFCICGNVIVLAACSIPALLCIQKVRRTSTLYSGNTETQKKTVDI